MQLEGKNLHHCDKELQGEKKYCISTEEKVGKLIVRLGGKCSSKSTGQKHGFYSIIYFLATVSEVHVPEASYR